MTNRERLLAIMAGKPPDRIPWIPRLLLWYNAHRKAGTLPDRYRDWSLRDIERDLGLGTPTRDGHVFRTELRGVEVRPRWLNEMELLTEYITPAGTVTTLFRSSELLRRKAIQDLQVEFMLKRREDYRELSALLRARGKTLCLHGDNDTRQILRHIEQAGYGMVECFVTHPMVPTTLAEARAAWKSRVIIWGGVPSAILEEPYTDAQFEAFMEDVFRTIAPGDAFILGVADNVMPTSKIERVRRVTEMVEEWGRYPIGAGS